MTSVESMYRFVGLLEQGRNAEAVAEMERFVRLARVERGERVIPFPRRPRRSVPRPVDLPPAA